MKELIEQRTLFEKKVKAKRQELDGINQQIEDIRSTDLFSMTLEKYAKKSLLHDYHYEQSVKLSKYVESVRLDNISGDLGKQITDYIMQEADNCTQVKKAFEAFESNPNNNELEEAYCETFNNKVDELRDEALELLDGYFNTVDQMQARILKAYLNNELPAPITAVDIETNAESKIKGIPFDYARRTSKRKVVI